MLAVLTLVLQVVGGALGALLMLVVLFLVPAYYVVPLVGQWREDRWKLGRWRATLRAAGVAAALVGLLAVCGGGAAILRA